MHEHGEAEQSPQERRGTAVRTERPPAAHPLAGARRAGARRRARGPRPVRPTVVAVAVRPPQLERPACRAAPRRPGQRVLARRAPAVPPVLGLRMQLRRGVAGVGLVLATAAAVVGLGTLADAAAQWRTPASVAAPAVPTVTVHTEETVWELAARVEPTATGRELAAVVDRIVTANALGSFRLHPGQVLRVTAG